MKRPLIRFDETIPVNANMYFAIHSLQHPAPLQLHCGAFLLWEDGVVPRLHRMSQDLVEVG